MSSDREFIEQRLTIVERQLSNSDNEYTYTGHGRGRRHVGYEKQTQNPLYEYEARILHKLIAQTHEGQTIKALRSWRRRLGALYAEHRRQHKALLDSIDAWWSLPPDIRYQSPQPPALPPAILVDQQGIEWQVNDALLSLLDDMQERVQKWIEEE